MKKIFTFLLIGLTIPLLSQNFPDEMQLSADGTRLQLGGHSTTGLYNESKIRIIELTFPSDNFFAEIDAAGDNDVMGAVTIDGEFFDSVGVRFKGATSDFRNNSEKKSFNISMNAFIEDQDVRGYETLNLNGNYEDPSSIREILFNHIGRNYTPALKTNFAELYINGTYWGPYENVQQLDGEYTREWFLSNDGTRWRAEQEGNEPGAGGYNLKKTSRENPWTDLALGTEKLNLLSTDNDLYDNLKDYLDIDKALWFVAHENIFTDSDGYINKGGSDYYVMWEAETGRLIPLEYDGNSVMQLGNTNAWTPFYKENEVDFPLMNRLFASPELRQRYLAHYRVILEDYFTPENMDQLIDGYAAQIRESIEMDTKRITEPADFEAEIINLKNHVRSRRDFLLANTEMPATGLTISNVTTISTAPTREESVSITATVSGEMGTDQVRLYYGSGIVGTFDRVVMTDNGNGTYSATIPAQDAGDYVRYYVEATAADAAKTVTFAPRGAEHDVYVYRVNLGATQESEVVINEFMASNDETIADQDGEFDDWIELFNTTNADIDLTGYFLSDNSENLDKYDIPDGTIIPANGYLTVWADEDGMQEGLHANFKISASGEELFLVNSDTVVIDEITFGAQKTDISYARTPNGIGAFAFKTPTFGVNNDEGTTSLNEVDFGSNELVVYPNPASDYISLEMKNVGTQEVNVKMFDLYGRLILQQDFNSSSIQLNVSVLEMGIYFLVINEHLGQKVMIAR